MCYCRHKMKHVGKGCDAPMDICMTFNGTANSLIKYNYARRIDASECKELLHKAYEHNLVQCGENVRQGVTFICIFSTYVRHFYHPFFFFINYCSTISNTTLDYVIILFYNIKYIYFSIIKNRDVSISANISFY